MKKQNGITLIALVITIIVLLILAGVSISAITGENGIVEKAKDAREKTEVAGKEEQDVLSGYEEEIDKALENSETFPYGALYIREDDDEGIAFFEDGSYEMYQVNEGRIGVSDGVSLGTFKIEGNSIISVEAPDVIKIVLTEDFKTMMFTITTDNQTIIFTKSSEIMEKCEHVWDNIHINGNAGTCEKCGIERWQM